MTAPTILADRTSGPPVPFPGELAQSARGGYLSVMRILVIEDDRETASYLAKALSEAGHVADQAHDGEAGLEQASEGSYDALVVDRMLPKRDGLSLIAALRAAGNRVPVLILSALGQVDDRVTGLRAGGDDYLPKPYAFSELLARIEVLARRNDAAGGGDRLPRRRPRARPPGAKGSPRRRSRSFCSRGNSGCSNI